MLYPCNNCIVLACCTIHCLDFYKFLNYMSDNIGKMTADEINKIRKSVPSYIIHRIEGLMLSGDRFAKSHKSYNYPNNIRFVKKNSTDAIK